MELDVVEIVNKIVETISSNNIDDRTRCCVSLQNLAEFCKYDECRKSIAEQKDIFTKLVEVCEVLLEKDDQLSGDDWNFLTTVFRVLRNCCAGYGTNIEFGKILDFASVCVCSFSKQRQNSSLEATIALRSCLQICGNMVAQCQISKQTVWQLFSENGVFVTLLLDQDAKVVEYVMMVLYNCMAADSMECNSRNELLVALTDALMKEIVDWGILSLEKLLKCNDFSKNYDSLPLGNRFVILDLMVEQLDRKNSDSDVISSDTLIGVKESFVQDVLDIVKVCNSQFSDLKCVEITKQLSVLCSASVLDSYRFILRTFEDLLEVAIDTLKAVHLLGKQNTNLFSPNITHQIPSSDDSENPVFCFKKDLVRLIGNMCYQFKDNQDLARRLDAIPLVLDCCNVDAKNPYMIQWCILAVRNLLDNNPENQAVLAQISISEGMENSFLFKEMGLTVEIEEGKPVLKSVAKTV